MSISFHVSLQSDMHVKSGHTCRPSSSCIQFEVLSTCIQFEVLEVLASGAKIEFQGRALSLTLFVNDSGEVVSVLTVRALHCGGFLQLQIEYRLRDGVFFVFAFSPFY